MYDFTCKKCGHDADFHECEKSGGYFDPSHLECPSCGSLELKDNNEPNK